MIPRPLPAPLFWGFRRTRSFAAHPCRFPSVINGPGRVTFPLAGEPCRSRRASPVPEVALPGYSGLETQHQLPCLLPAPGFYESP